MMKITLSFLFGIIGLFGSITAQTGVISVNANGAEPDPSAMLDVSGTNYPTYSGGGGSYNAGTNRSNTSGVRTGNGQTIISL
ncbi:MAG: hypothetical protein IT223_10560 [Crocinitomicaceae bacterium]|nr:hypothetical protein [Crocinitomicaceae bacterium]